MCSRAWSDSGSVANIYYVASYTTHGNRSFCAFCASRSEARTTVRITYALRCVLCKERPDAHTHTHKNTGQAVDGSVFRRLCVCVCEYQYIVSMVIDVGRFLIGNEPIRSAVREQCCWNGVELSGRAVSSVGGVARLLKTRCAISNLSIWMPDRLRRDGTRRIGSMCGGLSVITSLARNATSTI